MTREMNSGLSAEGKSVAYPFNADNQEKPDWHREWYAQNTAQEIQKMMCRCHYESKERKLDDWIKPYIDSINERFKRC